MTTRFSLVVVLGAFAWAGAPFGDAADPFVPSITAEGVAVQQFVPDRVELSLTIKVVSDSRERSQDAVDAAHKLLVSELVNIGVAEKDIGLRLRTLKRESQWNRGRREFLGFACTESVEVIVRTLDKLSTVTEVLAGIEDLELDGMVFRSAREGEARREALLQAADAAREKAEALAKNAGVKITRLLELKEDSPAYFESGAIGNRLTVVDSSEGVANRSVRLTVVARYEIE